MKKLVLMFMASALMASGAFAQQLNISSKKSSVKWTGTKLSGEHFGTIGVKNGTLVMDDGKLSAVNITMDMSSILCTDIEGDGAQKLEGHLKSPDFFDVKNHPIASFVSDEVQQNGPNTVVIGKLTIKGVTKDCEFNVSLEPRESTVMAIGKLEFDRTLYGIKYGSGSFFEDLGDRMIEDMVSLEFNVLALPQ